MANRETPYIVGTIGRLWGRKIVIDHVYEDDCKYRVRFVGSDIDGRIRYEDFIPLHPSTNTRGGVGSGLFGPGEPLEVCDTEADDGDLPY